MQLVTLIDLQANMRYESSRVAFADPGIFVAFFATDLSIKIIPTWVL